MAKAFEYSRQKFNLARVAPVPHFRPRRLLQGIVLVLFCDQ
jgi:hypothetical protein